MTFNEMKLQVSSAECFVPPTIEGLFAVNGGLRISPNSLKTWWPGTELNDSRFPVFSNLLILRRTQRTRRTGKTVFVCDLCAIFLLHPPTHRNWQTRETQRTVPVLTHADENTATHKKRWNELNRMQGSSVEVNAFHRN